MRVLALHLSIVQYPRGRCQAVIAEGSAACGYNAPQACCPCWGEELLQGDVDQFGCVRSCAQRTDGIAVHTWLGTMPDAYGRSVRCRTLIAYYVVGRWPACGILGNRRVLTADPILTTVQYSCKCGKGATLQTGVNFLACSDSGPGGKCYCTPIERKPNSQ